MPTEEVDRGSDGDPTTRPRGRGGLHVSCVREEGLTKQLGPWTEE